MILNKSCKNCKHDHVRSDCEPCNICNADTMDKWEPKRYIDKSCADCWRLCHEFGDSICCDCDDELSKYKEKPTEDNVNHPKHYEGSIECIDAMLESQGKEAVQHFCICNAFKYLWRHQRKNGLEDIKKAQWYINKFIELAEDQDD